MRFSSVLFASLFAATLSAAASAAPPARALIYAGRSAAVAPARSDGLAALESAARAVVRTRAPWSAPLALGGARTMTLRNGERVVRMPQTHRGLPVVLRGTSVAFDKGGVARLATVRLEEALPDDTTPAIDAVQAAEIAARRVGFPMSAESAKLAIWPSPERPTLAWVLSGIVPGRPLAPVVVVDAKTGDVVVRYNAASDLNRASVYASNPLKSPTLINVTLRATAAGGTLDNELVHSQSCIDQGNVKPVDIGIGFPIDIHLCDLLQIVDADANGDFVSVHPAADTEPEDAFAELSIFYHTNRAYDFFRAMQPGFKVQQGAINTVSNLRLPSFTDPTTISDPTVQLETFQNAFFAPANPLFASLFGIEDGAMWFGQGPSKDYSYDGDVVYHEFTHAVVNATIQLVGIPHHDEYGVVVSPGGMNEGLADYFSSAITGDGDVGEYAAKDISAGLPAIRSLTGPDACPTAIGGEVHQDSTLFAGALWDVRKSLNAAAGAAFDLAVFSAMNVAPSGDLGFEELANLIIQEVTDGPGAATANALTAAFTTRGVLPRCTRILESTGQEMNGPEALSGIWFAPGTDTTGLSETGYTPGVIQLHAAAPAGSNALTIAFTEVDLGASPLGGGGQATPFAPKVLVRFGAEPIAFTYNPYKATLDSAVDAPKSGNAYTVTVPVPPGATSAYVMIGNSGQSDGAYRALSAIFAGGTNGAGGGGQGGEGGAGDGGNGASGGAGGAGGDGTTADDDSGCSCSVPGAVDARGAGGALAGLLLAGFAVARRRRARG